MSINRTQHFEEAHLVTENFQTYLNGVIHDWLKTLTTFAYTLVPAFFILDFFTMPGELLHRFGYYRLACTLVVLIQYFVIRHSNPSSRSIYHGYFVSLMVGGSITLMTVDLGGFDSSYYAGLNLVIIGVNLLLPWPAIHTILNVGMVIAMYLTANLIIRQPFEATILVNNLFFLFSTGFMAVGINYVKHRLVKQEFFLRTELQKARDSLWSEMEIAKRIQTALLPEQKEPPGLEIASVMYPAKEVGGDYYDIIESANGDQWITIGDVSGHGVDSGLIMMMAQTSILSLVNKTSDCKPSAMLTAVNSVIKENISRLGSDHYMTITAICFRDSQMTFAGKHQDILIYRSALNTTEAIPTQGTWLGVVEDVSGFLEDTSVTVEKGDVVLLFTDGITEAVSKNGEMFGQRRLEQALNQYANLPVGKISSKIIEELTAYQEEQYDDITLVVVKKTRSNSRRPCR